MPDIFIPIADGDGNNSDGILKEIIISLTGESFIKLFDTKYTNLNTIEKKLMHIAFRLILSRNFFISKNQLIKEFKLFFNRKYYKKREYVFLIVLLFSNLEEVK